MNIAVLAILYLVAQVASLMTWQVCFAFVAGVLYHFVLFRWHYGWWPDFNMGGEDDQNSQLPRIDPDRTNYR